MAMAPGARQPRTPLSPNRHEDRLAVRTAPCGPPLSLDTHVFRTARRSSDGGRGNSCFLTFTC
ncbi:hypothetical protein EYF80_064479 [Liparis tanakae]|uniref:Uncharacterized protein n=1 Tax=Liparis tanakae TaxID=230148 RepID=A0A4Z2E9M7_9TELE|nr:hypothetical protein EYF80_064479 [Liparis tanakae]